MKRSVVVSGVVDCDTLNVKMTVVDTVGGNVVGAGSFTTTSGEVEFDDSVATIGVLELFIMDTCTEPESPA